MRLTHAMNLFHFLQLDLRPRPINYQKENKTARHFFPFLQSWISVQYETFQFHLIFLHRNCARITTLAQARGVPATDHTAGRKRSPWLKSKSNQLISTPRTRSPGASSWEYLFGLLTRLQQIRRVQTLRFISATTVWQHSEQNREDILDRVRTHWMCLQWKDTTFHRSLSKMTIFTVMFSIFWSASCNKGCLS